MTWLARHDEQIKKNASIIPKYLKFFPRNMHFTINFHNNKPVELAE